MFFHFALWSDNSETVEDSTRTLSADVNDDSRITEIDEIVPLDRTSDDHCTPEFIYSIVNIKQEPADENVSEDARYSVKQEPADYDDTDIVHCLLNVRL